MPAPYTKVNTKDLKVGIKYYDLTGAEYWPLVCTVTRSLSQQKNEVDVTTTCGQDFLPGNDDNSFEAEVLWLTAASYNGEEVVTASELWDIFNANGEVDIRLADDLDTPLNYGFDFAAQIFGFNDDAPTEGAVTNSLTFRVKGAISKLI